MAAAMAPRPREAEALLTTQIWPKSSPSAPRPHPALNPRTLPAIRRPQVIILRLCPSYVPERLLKETPTILTYDVLYDRQRDDPSPLANRRTRGPNVVHLIGSRPAQRPRNRVPTRPGSPKSKPPSPPKLDLSHRAGTPAQIDPHQSHSPTIDYGILRIVMIAGLT